MITTEPLSRYLRQLANMYASIIERKVYHPEANYHYDILLVIYHHQGPIMQSQLADLLHLEKSHVTSIVYYLLSEGFIDITENVLNKRDNILQLTTKGIASIEKVEQEVFNLNEKLTSGIDPERIDIFWQMLKTIEKNLEKESELI